ncbi:MAG TPA: peroxiredoxin [Gammaproteobacteria bacterium]|nr:peroxiredoxin [Gammaproteobacteria bacterium]
MSIQDGEKVPAGTLTIMGEKGPQPTSTETLFSGKKVVLFSVPGAFTPTCSAAHLPGFVVKADEIKAKGVDSIICMAVNDVFVMDAWGKDQNADELIMAADGNGDFAKSLGLELDGTAMGMGLRAQRFAMIIDDGIATKVLVEPGRGLDVSSAESVLSHL